MSDGRLDSPGVASWGGRFAPLRRSLIGDTTHYLQGAAVLTGLLYHVVLYHVDSRARLAGSGAQGD